MSALEREAQEIIEKFQRLDAQTQARVLTALSQTQGETRLSLGEWLERASTLRAEIRAKYGQGYFFNSQAMLNEIREEASWPRW